MAWSAAARAKSAQVRASRRNINVGRRPKILTAKSGSGRRFVKGGAVLVGFGSRGSKARFARAGLKKAPQFLAHTRKSYVKYGRRVR